MEFKVGDKIKILETATQIGVNLEIVGTIKQIEKIQHAGSGTRMYFRHDTVKWWCRPKDAQKIELKIDDDGNMY